MCIFLAGARQRRQEQTLAWHLGEGYPELTRGLDFWKVTPHSNSQNKLQSSRSSLSWDGHLGFPLTLGASASQGDSRGCQDGHETCSWHRGKADTLRPSERRTDMGEAWRTGKHPCKASQERIFSDRILANLWVLEGAPGYYHVGQV